MDFLKQRSQVRPLTRLEPAQQVMALAASGGVSRWQDSQQYSRHYICHFQIFLLQGSYPGYVN